MIDRADSSTPLDLHINPDGTILPNFLIGVRSQIAYGLGAFPNLPFQDSPFTLPVNGIVVLAFSMSLFAASGGSQLAVVDVSMVPTDGATTDLGKYQFSVPLNNGLQHETNFAFMLQSVVGTGSTDIPAGQYAIKVDVDPFVSPGTYGGDINDRISYAILLFQSSARIHGIF